MIWIFLIGKKNGGMAAWRCWMEFTDIRFLWRTQTARGICRVSWVFSISFIQTQTLPLRCVSLAKSHPWSTLSHELVKNQWTALSGQACLMFHGWQEGCPLNGYFFPFLPIPLKGWPKQMPSCFFSPGIFFFFFNAWAHKIRKKGRKADIWGCCVQRYRLGTLQGIQ